MIGARLGQRDAEPREVCTCGAPAVVVYVGAFGETGSCGRQRPPAESCRWCLYGPHDGRCPAYRVRPLLTAAQDGSDQ